MKISPVTLVIFLTMSFFAGLCHAQMPRLEWQHDVSRTGDGTRSYVYYRHGSGYPQDPELSANWSISTEHGVYLIIPTNMQGSSDYLPFVTTPFLSRTSGFQVVKLDDSGSFLWQRFIPAGPSYAPGFREYAGLRFVTMQARVTPDGGLAMVIGEDYVVLSPSGEQRLRLDSYCGQSDGYAVRGPQLNHEGMLVVTASVLAPAPAGFIVCAVDQSGVEVDRVTVAGNALTVIDFRRDLGFLIKHGVYNNNGWVSVALELVSSTGSRWRRTDAGLATFYASSFESALSPNGDTWIALEGGLTRIDRTGTLRWQKPIVGSVKYWLADGSALLSNEGDRWMVIDDSGNQRWRRDLAILFYSAFSVNPNQLRVVQRNGDLVRLNIIDMTSGALQSNERALDWDAQLLTSAPIGAAGALDVYFGTPSLSRSYLGSCGLAGLRGYCVDSINFAQINLRLTNTATGVSNTLDSSQLAFALPSHAFETQPYPALSIRREQNVDRLTHLYSKQYVHDGIHNQIQIQKLTPTGNVVWTQNFSGAYDLAKATMRDLEGRLYLSAEEYLPLPHLPFSVGRLWAIDAATGEVIWTTTLASWQRIETFAASNICGLTQLAPHFVQCVDRDTGELTQNQQVQGVPAFSGIEATGVSATGIRVRVFEFVNGGIGFSYANIDSSGQFGDRIDHVFSVAPNEWYFSNVRLNPALGIGSFLATATVVSSSAPAQTEALLVARFDGNGNRTWQTRINRQLRDALHQGEMTAIAETSSGEIYVSLHPRTPLGQNKTELCKISANGVLLACVEAPVAGRISSISPDGEALRVWIDRDIDNAQSNSGAELYRFRQGAFGPRELSIPGYFSAANNAVLDVLGRHYITLVSRRSAQTQTNQSVKVISMIHTAQEFVFADSFE
jgi:hypothetical protein